MLTVNFYFRFLIKKTLIYFFILFFVLTFVILNCLYISVNFAETSLKKFYVNKNKKKIFTVKKYFKKSFIITFVLRKLYIAISYVNSI